MMHIEAADSLAVYYYLLYEAAIGKQWMAYSQENGHMTVLDTFCFPRMDELVDFLQLHDEFGDTYRYAPISPVIEQLRLVLEKRRGLHAETVNVQLKKAPPIDLPGFLRRRQAAGNKWVTFEKRALLRERDLYCAADKWEQPGYALTPERRVQLVTFPIKSLLKVLDKLAVPGEAGGIRVDTVRGELTAAYFLHVEPEKRVKLLEPCVKTSGLLPKRMMPPNDNQHKIGSR